jgi:hypothetical protein
LPSTPPRWSAIDRIMPALVAYMFTIAIYVVWPQLVPIAAIGSVYFAFSLSRFRRVIFGG